MMPARPASAAARRTRPANRRRQVFGAGIPRCCAGRVDERLKPGSGDGFGTNRKRSSGACQKRASMGCRFLQRSAASCRTARPVNQGNISEFPLVVLVGVRGFEPPAPASRKLRPPLAAAPGAG
jgi:hypothetical protein